jgi:hypothetical protein
MTRTIPGPQPDPETQQWWEACGEGKLSVRHCKACGENHFPPRNICPYCFSDDTEARQVAGTGQIYSFSVMRRVAKPYVLAYVTLDEGPTMMTNIATADPDAVRIGQRVRVAFEATDTGYKLPVFTPL